MAPERKNKLKNRPKIVVLLDVHAILHRAYHALPAFTTRAGEPTGGLYGLTAMIIKIARDLQPDYLLACYDLPEPTFRKAIYDDYKAGRPSADEELVEQIKRSRDLLAALNIPTIEARGFEADDLIGTIANRLKRSPGQKIIIASGDLDTLQLVDGKRVIVYTLKKGLNDTIIYDEPAVRERFGFPPSRLPDYKGLAGDPSDNIVGVPGIGAKTASRLIVAFGGVEEIYAHLKRSPNDFTKAGFSARVQKLLLDHEEEALFSKTLATIRLDAPAEWEPPERPWREGVDRTIAREHLESLEFRTLWPRLVAVLSTEEGEGEGEGVGKKSTDLKIKAGEKAIWQKIKLAGWLLDSEHVPADPDEVLRSTGTTNLSAALEFLEAKLAEIDLTRVYQEIELPIAPLLEAAAARGIALDVGYLKKLSATYHSHLQKLRTEIYKLAGVEFNLNSPKQLGEVLFDRLKLPPPRRTPGGARSTRERELFRLRASHPIINPILEYRELQKLLSTYVDVLPGLVGSDGRLHTTLNQAGTTTGRMSSSDPNLQNVPAGGEWGKAVRRAFVASPGHQWATFDYSQIEMRVLAVLSGDERLRQIFTTGQDVHTAVAAQVFGVALARVTPEMRRRAKVINFGIIYGMGVRALRENLGSTAEEAKKFYEEYFKNFAQIRAYFDRVKGEAARRGYTETFFGRRRYFPDLRSRLPQTRAAAERMAMNAPLQGTAADIVKLAMRDAARELGAQKLSRRAHFLLQVHDELIYEIETPVISEAVSVIRRAMESAAAPLGLPFTVNATTGPNWAETKPF